MLDTLKSKYEEVTSRPEVQEKLTSFQTTMSNFREKFNLPSFEESKSFILDKFQSAASSISTAYNNYKANAALEADAVVNDKIKEPLPAEKEVSDGISFKETISNLALSMQMKFNQVFNNDKAEPTATNTNERGSESFFENLRSMFDSEKTNGGIEIDE